MGFYEKVEHDGYAFVFTVDGLIVPYETTRQFHNQYFESLSIVADIYNHSYRMIIEINGGGLSFSTLDQARAHIRRIDDIGYLDGDTSVVLALSKMYSVILPASLYNFATAIHELMYPITPPIPSGDRSGYVYLVQSVTGYYKIGRAKDPRKRTKTFGVKLPFEIELAHIIACADYLQAESYLHEKFADKRANGEWFLLSEGDVVYIKSLERLDL
jgi:hypothetical protein